VIEDGLCERCSVISLDDGAFRDDTAPGDELTEADICLFPSDCSSDEEEQLRLDYEHYDLFPRLPSLTASAVAGCSFCDALREATMNLLLPPHLLPEISSPLRLETATLHAHGALHALCRREHY
jgi:hypothetical protein